MSFYDYIGTPTLYRPTMEEQTIGKFADHGLSALIVLIVGWAVYKLGSAGIKYFTQWNDRRITHYETLVDSDLKELKDGQQALRNDLQSLRNDLAFYAGKK